MPIQVPIGRNRKVSAVIGSLDWNISEVKIIKKIEREETGSPCPLIAPATARIFLLLLVKMIMRPVAARATAGGGGCSDGG
jgi:hypothetical protein